MKRRSIEPEVPESSPELGLAQALQALRSVEEVGDFLRDLCTPAELEALTDRWRVVPYLLDEVPYREIHERTGVSITTIGRVARFITQGNGGYVTAARRLARRAARTGVKA